MSSLYKQLQTSMFSYNSDKIACCHKQPFYMYKRAHIWNSSYAAWPIKCEISRNMHLLGATFIMSVVFSKSLMLHVVICNKIDKLAAFFIMINIFYVQIFKTVLFRTNSQTIIHVMWNKHRVIFILIQLSKFVLKSRLFKTFVLKCGYLPIIWNPFVICC